MEEGDECDDESGGSKTKSEDARGKVDAIATKENPDKTKVGGSTKDAPVNGIVVVGGRKTCKHCGSPLED